MAGAYFHPVIATVRNLANDAREVFPNGIGAPDDGLASYPESARIRTHMLWPDPGFLSIAFLIAAGQVIGAI